MLEIIKIITPILTPIIGLFATEKLLSRSMKKVQIFKQIRKEYLEDKIVGYYSLQSFLGFRLPKNEIDFILNSEDAYSILKVIKNSNGKYTFDGKKFKSKISTVKFCFAYIGYFIASIVLMLYLSFYDEIKKYINIKSYITIFIFLFAIFMPILINCIIYISEVRDVRFLEKLTQKRKRNT